MDTYSSDDDSYEDDNEYCIWIDNQWDYSNISITIPIEDVIKYPNETWNRHSLSMNKNICMKVIRSDLPNAIGSWNWFWISVHISMEDKLSITESEYRDRYYR
jgi:hypothetical protein